MSIPHFDGHRGAGLCLLMTCCVTIIRPVIVTRLLTELELELALHNSSSTTGCFSRSYNPWVVLRHKGFDHAGSYQDDDDDDVEDEEW